MIDHARFIKLKVCVLVCVQTHVKGDKYLKYPILDVHCPRCMWIIYLFSKCYSHVNQTRCVMLI